jgi:NADPH:quinone reductase-like Zn-dependent oxidoreductase
VAFYTDIAWSVTVQTMKAWAIEKYGDNSVVKMMDLSIPSYGDDEVLIEVRAASINPVDFKIRNGELKFVLPYRFPLILGNDCAGIVKSVGAKVSKFEVGDEVYTRPHKDRIGTLAEYIAAKEIAVAKKPKNLSFEEAASIPLVGLTSWQALLTRSGLKKGQRVFIPAGSGGVGTFAVQLAKHFGGYVVTNTSTKNVEFVKKLGADEVIDYKSQDFSQITSNIDIFFDTMGGETQRKAFSVLKRGGTIVSIVGPPTAAFAREVGLNLLIQAIAAGLSLWTNIRATLNGCRYIFLFMLPEGDVLDKIARLIEEGSILPVLDRTFRFENANEALAYVESGRARGKVVVSGMKNA